MQKLHKQSESLKHLDEAGVCAQGGSPRYGKVLEAPESRQALVLPPVE